MDGGGAEYGTGITRLLSPVDNVPNDAIVDSGWKRCHGVELHPHRGGGAAHSVRRWRSKWPAASIHIASNEYDVCTAPTLTSTEAERVQTHEMGDVAHAIACFIYRLQQAAATGRGDGGGRLETQNLVSDEFECLHTIDGEFGACGRLSALGVDDGDIHTGRAGEANPCEGSTSDKRRAWDEGVDEGSSLHGGGKGSIENGPSVVVRVEVACGRE